jgi:hypothetical protein
MEGMIPVILDCNILPSLYYGRRHIHMVVELNLSEDLIILKDIIISEAIPQTFI